MEKVCYGINDIDNDLITGINGTPLVTPLLAKDWAYSNLGTWWVERDKNGVNVLSAYGVWGQMEYLDITDSNGQNPYKSDSVEFIGGRPPVHR